MKKRMFKRCTALILSVAMVITSSGIVNAADFMIDGSQEKQNTITVTDGMLVAANDKTKENKEFTDEEKAILQSMDIQGKVHEITVPSDADELIEINTENAPSSITVTAKTFKGWVPVSATVVYKDAADVEQTMKVEDEDESEEFKGTFACDSSAYSVDVVYQYNYTISAEDQNAVRNIPYYIVKGIENLDTLSTLRSSLLSLAQAMPSISLKATELSKALAAVGTDIEIRDITDMSDEVTLNEASTGTAQFNLNILLTEYANADSKVEYLFESGAEVKAAAEKLAKQIDVFKNLFNLFGNRLVTDADERQLIRDYLDSMMTAFATVGVVPAESYSGYKNAEDADWSMLDMKDALIKNTSTDLDALVKAAKGKVSKHEDVTEAATVKVATTTLTATTNMYDITIQISADYVPVGQTDNATLTTTTPVTATITLAGGTTGDKVNAAIAEVLAEIEATGVTAWNSKYGCGIVEGETYTRNVSVTIKDDYELDQDIAYNITYAPKSYSYTMNDAAAVTVPYGYQMTLPAHEDPGKSYDYTVNGVAYNQTEVIRITTDTTITSAEGKFKDKYTINQIIASDYADELEDARANFLTQPALKTDSVLVRIPGAEDNLVTNENGKVYAKIYDGSWIPEAAVMYNGNTKGSSIAFVKNTDSKAAEGYKYVAVLEDEDYTYVDITYKLPIDIEKEELKSILNMASTEAITITNLNKAMNGLMKLYDDNTLLLVSYNNVELLLKAEGLKEETKTAINAIMTEGMDADGNLYLQLYAEEYDKAGRSLKYLYEKDCDLYERIVKQFNVVTENLDAIIADPAAMEFEVAGVKIGDKLANANGQIAALKDALANPPGKEWIAEGTTADTFGDLVVAAATVTSEKTFTNDDVADGLALRTEAGAITVTKPGELSVVIKVTDGTNSKNVTVGGFEMSILEEGGEMQYTFSQADIDALNAKLDAAVAELFGTNVKYYTPGAVTGMPEAGKSYTTMVINVEKKYTPTEYTVCLSEDGVTTSAPQTITILNPTITFDVPEAGYEYKWYIDNKLVDTASTNNKYTFNFANGEVDRLFINNQYIVTRITVDTNREALISFVEALNAEIKASGVTGANGNLDTAFILAENNGEYSIVFRSAAGTETQLQSIMMPVVQTLVLKSGYTAIDINGNSFIKGTDSVCIQTLVDSLIDGGLGTGAILNAINANGTINNNINAGSVVTVDGINNASNLGASLVKSVWTLTNNSGATNVNFYITLADLGNNAETLSKTRNLVATVDKYVSVNNTMDDDALDVQINVPDSVYELYLSAMLVQGYVTLDDITALGLEESIEYVLDLIDPIIDEENNVTSGTVENTAAQVGKDVDLSQYDETIVTVLKAIRHILKEENLVVTGEYSDDDTAWSGTLEYQQMKKALGSLGVDPILLERIVEYKTGKLSVNVDLTVDNFGTEYSALIIDVTKDGLAMHNYVKADEVVEAIAKAGENAVIVLLADIDNDVAVKAGVIVNLNGHSINGTVTNYADSAMVIADGHLETNSGASVASVNGNVTTLLGIGNNYYTIEAVTDKDGNITGYELVIDSEFMATAYDQTQWKTFAKQLATELAMDMVFSAFTSAAVSVDGNTIYNMEFEDLLATYKSEKNAIGEALEKIETENIRILINDIIANLTDFAAVAEAISAGNAIVEYEVTSMPWKLVLDITDENYITAGVVANTDSDKTKTRTLSVKVGGDDTSKLASLFYALADIVSTDDIAVTIDTLDVAYNTTDGLTADTSATINATIDLSKDAYVGVIGVLMAAGVEDNTALIEGLTKYFDEGETVTLVAALNALTATKIIDALENAHGKDFIDMVTGLGFDIEKDAADEVALETIYHDALVLVYKVLYKLALGGGNKTLGDLMISNDKDSYYRYNITRTNFKQMDINVTVVLCEKEVAPIIPIYPNAEIIKPIIKEGTTVDYEGFKVEGKYIYLDVDAFNGITDAQFKDLVDFEVKNGEVTSVDVTTVEGLVYAGSTVTVKAENKDQTTPVVDEETYTVIIVGDATRNGKVTSQDATKILAYVVGKAELDEIALLAADINNKGSVNAVDATLILQKATTDSKYYSRY